MNKKRGFTLIELLVVIAIIALLMAILMPTLARVRSAAKEAACAMNMRQVGICFSMYTNDNNGYFSDGARTTGGNVAGIGDWLTALDGGYKFESNLSAQQIEQVRERRRELSYIKDYGILSCPMATKNDPAIPRKFKAWGGGLYEDMTARPNGYLPYAPKEVTGSYAHNAWCNNIPAGSTRTNWNCDVKYCWRTTTVKGGADIPVLADSFRWGCNIRGDNEPPSYDGEGEPDNGTDEIRRVCINRHNGAIDILFMDWSVRRTRLKQLWDVNTKWNKNWVAEINQYGTPDFASEAPWMRNF